MVYFLGEDIFIPNPLEATDEGLLAVGGDLSVERLLASYSKGIFPWYNPDQPILWWSPIERPVFIPGDLKISKSFKQTIRSGKFSVEFDKNFKQVLDECSDTYFRKEDGTWLGDDMKTAYLKLHKMGYAHSVEVYFDNQMVGGLYGLSLGKGFFGESMFTRMSDASKFALFALSEHLKDWGFYFIDGQYNTNHLYSLGAKAFTNIEFLKMLNKAMKFEAKKGKWKVEIGDLEKRV
jgi:leucyl/phenylalanyl-tRNA--protein transferase